MRLGGYRVNLRITDTIPQRLADGWTEVMQEAVYTWAKGGTVAPDIEFIDDHDDEMVDKRIEGYQTGYNKEWTRREVGGYWHDFKEDEHMEKQRYVFGSMPMAMKRAIVSQWDSLHYAWLVDHPDLHYDKTFGYYWRIEVDGVRVKVKAWTVDKGKCPDQAFAEKWEKAGVPGGLYGYIGAMASIQPADLWRFVEGVAPPDLRIKGTEESRSGN